VPSVEVTFTALPAHVRTARLIAVAVARRAGVAEDLLDEIRLAVGEACSRAVGVNQRHAAQTPVALSLADDHDRYTVEVVDNGPPETGAADLDAFGDQALTGDPPPAGDDLATDPLPPGFGLAVIAGLVDDLKVDAGAGQTRVRMSWPVDAVAGKVTAGMSDA
jgi:serine/threonine-protein kinase RsbW